MGKGKKSRAAARTRTQQNHRGAGASSNHRGAASSSNHRGGGAQPDPSALLTAKERFLGLLEEGTEFLETLVSDMIEESNTHRSVLLRASANSPERRKAATKLESCYSKYVMLIKVLPTERFEAGISKVVQQLWVKHIQEVLKEASADETWLRTGIPEQYFFDFLRSVDAFCHHAPFVKVFLSDGGMESVAKFCASREANTIASSELAVSIFFIGFNCRAELDGEFVSQTVVFTLEKTGLLGQMLRCSIAVEPGEGEERLLAFLEDLGKCFNVIRKRLRSGTPTGDILDTLVATTDGTPIPQVMEHLIKLQKMARMTTMSEKHYSLSCGNCRTKAGKGQHARGLLKCSRCARVSYCSKECQKADWQKHKMLCKDDNTASDDKAAGLTVVNFMESNYSSVAQELRKKKEEHNVLEQDLVVVLDFYRDAPALRDEFEVKLIVEVPRPEIPDWSDDMLENPEYQDHLREGREENGQVRRVGVICRRCDQGIFLTHT